MFYLVKLTTKRGGKRELQIEANSPLQAKEEAMESYPGCTVDDNIVKLENLKLYSNGGVGSINVQELYIPFPK